MIEVQLPIAPDGHTYTVIFTSGNYIVIVIRDETYIQEHPRETSTNYAVQLILLESINDILVLEALRKDTRYPEEICSWLCCNIMDIATKNDLA